MAGDRIDGLAPDEILRRGITQVPQSQALFPAMTVRENVLMGGFLIRRKRALLAHFGSPNAILAASREELESVPGLPGKLAREMYRELHRTGV